MKMTDARRIATGAVLTVLAGSAAAHGDHGPGLLLEGVSHLLQAEHLPVTVTLAGVAVLAVRRRAQLRRGARRMVRRLLSRR